jgi:GST-like protein
VLRSVDDPVAQFLDASSYGHVVRWASRIQERTAVKRGQRVNKTTGPEEERVLERHDASDLD